MTTKQSIELLEALKKKVEKKYRVHFGIAPMDKIVKLKIYYKIIFDHGFQKALWGNLWTGKDGKPLVLKQGKKLMVDMTDYKVAWQYHSEKLALAEDYLEYLKAFV